MWWWQRGATAPTFAWRIRCGQAVLSLCQSKAECEEDLRILRGTTQPDATPESLDQFAALASAIPPQEALTLAYGGFSAAHCSARGCTASISIAVGARWSTCGLCHEPLCPTHRPLPYVVADNAKPETPEPKAGATDVADTSSAPAGGAAAAASDHESDLDPAETCGFLVVTPEDATDDGADGTDDAAGDGDGDAADAPHAPHTLAIQASPPPAGAAGSDGATAADDAGTFALGAPRGPDPLPDVLFHETALCSSCAAVEHSRRAALYLDGHRLPPYAVPAVDTAASKAQRLLRWTAKSVSYVGFLPYVRTVHAALATVDAVARYGPTGMLLGEDVIHAAAAVVGMVRLLGDDDFDADDDKDDIHPDGTVVLHTAQPAKGAMHDGVAVATAAVVAAAAAAEDADGGGGSEASCSGGCPVGGCSAECLASVRLSVDQPPHDKSSLRAKSLRVGARRVQDIALSAWYVAAAARELRGRCPGRDLQVAAAAGRTAMCPNVVAEALYVAPFAVEFAYSDVLDAQRYGWQQGYRLVSTQPAADVYRPAFYVFARRHTVYAHGEATGTAIIALRGTKTVEDMLTDVAIGMMAPFVIACPCGGLCDPAAADADGRCAHCPAHICARPEGPKGSRTTAHHTYQAPEGVVRAAQYIDTQVGDVARAFAADGYNVVVTGHSLGGGVATLVGLTLAHPPPRVTGALMPAQRRLPRARAPPLRPSAYSVIAYAPPPVSEPALSALTRAHTVACSRSDSAAAANWPRPALHEPDACIHTTAPPHLPHLRVLTVVLGDDPVPRASLAAAKDLAIAVSAATAWKASVRADISGICARVLALWPPAARGASACARQTFEDDGAFALRQQRDHDAQWGALSPGLPPAPLGAAAAPADEDDDLVHALAGIDGAVPTSCLHTPPPADGTRAIYCCSGRLRPPDPSRDKARARRRARADHARPRLCGSVLHLIGHHGAVVPIVSAPCAEAFAQLPLVLGQRGILGDHSGTAYLHALRAASAALSSARLREAAHSALAASHAAAASGGSTFLTFDVLRPHVKRPNGFLPALIGRGLDRWLGVQQCASTPACARPAAGHASSPELPEGVPLSRPPASVAVSLTPTASAADVAMPRPPTPHDRELASAEAAVALVEGIAPHPPTYVSFDEAESCACCLERFAWAAVGSSEQANSASKRHCGGCGAVVCSSCSAHTANELPAMYGLAMGTHMCDRCIFSAPRPRHL